MTTPVRLQLSRKKGFSLQAHSLAVNGLPAVNCARPGKYKNPLRVGQWRNYAAADAVQDFRRWITRDPTVRSFENVFGKPRPREEIANLLAGKNLACWCRLCAAHEAKGKPLHIGCADCAPCHVDVLGELANAPICEAIDERRIEKARAG